MTPAEIDGGGNPPPACTSQKFHASKRTDCVLQPFRLFDAGHCVHSDSTPNNSRGSIVAARTAGGWEASAMTKIRALHHFVVCPKCHESVFAAEGSEYVSTTEVHHLWCCWECQLKFETL